MVPMDTILYIVSLFIANVIQGITGFAGNILAMPGCVIAIGVDTARNTLNLLSLVSGVFMVVWFHKHIVWRECGRMLLFIMPGMALGVWVYNIFPADGLLVPYGIVVTAIGIWYLAGSRRTTAAEKPLPRLAMVLVVLAAGLMQGMFVSGGPLLVIYAVTVLRDKEDFRATLCVLWLVLNIIIFAQGLMAGMITPEVGRYALIGLVPLIAATVLGGLLQKRLDQAAFMKLTYVLLILSGALLVGDALL